MLVAVLIPTAASSLIADRMRRSAEMLHQGDLHRLVERSRASQHLAVTAVLSQLASIRDLNDETIARVPSSVSGVRSVEVMTTDGLVLARAVGAPHVPARCPPRVLSSLLRPGVMAVITLDENCESLAALAPPSLSPPPSPWLRPSTRATHFVLGAAALASIITALLILRTAKEGAPKSGGTAELITAAGKVGGGDLAVRVAAEGELAALTSAFNQMVEELAMSRSRVEYLQRIAGWQELARRLAHEIKNPLTPIQLAVQELARRYKGDDAAFAKTLETTREVVEEEVATLRRLVGAFSEFARLPDVKPAPADLAEFVRDMASSRALLDELDPGVEVRFEAGDAAVPVRIDRIMFRRAVENLLRNAVEAMTGRGGHVWVRVETRDVRETDGPETTQQAWLVVEDDGPGVAAAQQEKVFDPYFTTKATGTGLGLAIVRKIALDHDGDVGVADRAGGGARFVLTLPLTAEGKRPRRSFVTFTKG